VFTDTTGLIMDVEISPYFGANETNEAPNTLDGQFRSLTPEQQEWIGVIQSETRQGPAQALELSERLQDLATQRSACTKYPCHPMRLPHWMMSQTFGNPMFWDIRAARLRSPTVAH
jgi:hypothetical protein